MSGSRRPVAAWILIILHFFIGIGGIISGGMLVVQPDGRLMSWDPGILAGTPFTNFIIPGLILVLLIGVFPIFVGIGMLKKPAWRGPDVINPTKRYYWAWAASWAVGVILIIWITVEWIMLGYISVLQPIVLGWGLLTVILTLLPQVKQRYLRR